MRVLTFRRPFAWAIGAGLKPIENRTWKPPLDGAAFGVHAGQRRSHPDDLLILERCLGATTVRQLGGMTTIARMIDDQAGLVVASVRAVLAPPYELSPAENRWWAGPGWLAWRLHLVERFPVGRDRRFSGRLSFWDLDSPRQLSNRS